MNATASRGSSAARRSKPPEIPARPFFQREVKAFRLRAADGRARIIQVRVVWEGHRARRILTWSGFRRRPGERIVEALLSCGHWYAYRRPAVPPSNRAGCPCAGCGAGLRKATTEGRLRRRVQRALFDVFGQPASLHHSAVEEQTARQQHIIEMVLAAWDARSLHATTQAAEGLYHEIDLHGRMAGLFEDPEAEDDDEQGARL